MKRCIEKRPGNWGVKEVIIEKNANPLQAAVVIWKRIDCLLDFWAECVLYARLVHVWFKTAYPDFRPYQTIKSLAFWMPHGKIWEESEKGISVWQYYP